MSIGIVGGGASGMILASKLTNKNVTLIERNSKLGKKLSLTGNGKCNFTNMNFDDIDSIYNNDFAKNIYYKYDNNSFIKYFADIGIVAKCENHKGIDYIYPNNNKSSSVIYNLLDKIVSNGVNIKLYSNVVKISYNNKFELELESGEKLYFDKLVIASGGATYKKTGSDGMCYNLIKSLGHSIIETFPSLCALKYSDNDLKKVIGVRCDAKITCNFKNIDFSEIGEVQFTDFGISGIPVFNLSRHVSRYINLGNTIDIYLDFFSFDKCNDFNKHIENLFDLLKSRRLNINYKNINDFLCGFLPDEVALIILNRAKIKSKSISDLSDDELYNIAKNIVRFKISIIGTASFDNAQITIGGVSVDEVNIDTLESKLIKNLYFTGEVLDIDGKCGGYNLQLAYSTASIVADSLGG